MTPPSRTTYNFAKRRNMSIECFRQENKRKVWVYLDQDGDCEPTLLLDDEDEAWRVVTILGHKLKPENLPVFIYNDKHLRRVLDLIHRNT